MDYPGIIISFLGSLGLFLFGMTVLSSALQKTAGSKMKQLLGKMSKSRFRGVLFGAGVTAVIQSSTATTVMAVGFVNAGIITLTQTVGIIMGANIGSTTTSWLVSSVEWASFLKPATLGAISAAVGALMLLFSKKEKIKNIGEVIVGFGVLFIGLSQMPAAVKPLAETDTVRDLFVTFGNYPILAMFVGILVTAVIQSSTVSIGILQSMAITGVIPWSAAVFIVLGQNVGTCFTTMLTSIGANRNTRAASYVHFVYNAVGAIVFGILAFVFFTFINPLFGETTASSTNISMIHTGYNVLLLMLLFPLGGVIMKIAVKMAGRDKLKTAEEPDLIQLDDSILETPVYAFENSIKAINRLTDLLRTNIEWAIAIFINKKFNEIDEFNDYAAKADKTNSAVKSFLTKLYSEKLTEPESVFTATLLHNLTRLERINAHTKGIIAKAEELRDSKIEYSPFATAKLQTLSEKTTDCYDEAVGAFIQSSPELANSTLQSADEVLDLYDEYKTGHLERIGSHNSKYGIQSSILFLEVARHLSRIASNSKSIAETAVGEESIETVEAICEDGV
ncbi:MAG: Na/Pi cotransporter family protein [Oscillospiraceae bacterium]|nr:Na/Pi cotransporter family protein [Oscillospiraceae bacterium]